MIRKYIELVVMKKISLDWSMQVESRVKFLSKFLKNGYHSLELLIYKRWTVLKSLINDGLLSIFLNV